MQPSGSLEYLKYISEQKKDQIYSVHLVPELVNMILIAIVLRKVTNLELPRPNLD